MTPKCQLWVHLESEKMQFQKMKLNFPVFYFSSSQWKTEKCFTDPFYNEKCPPSDLLIIFTPSLYCNPVEGNRPWRQAASQLCLAGAARLIICYGQIKYHVAYGPDSSSLLPRTQTHMYTCAHAKDNHRPVCSHTEARQESLNCRRLSCCRKTP